MIVYAQRSRKNRTFPFEINLSLVNECNTQIKINEPLSVTFAFNVVLDMGPLLKSKKKRCIYYIVCFNANNRQIRSS